MKPDEDDDGREWPGWFPENAYFKSAFPMTSKQYAEDVPDERLRTGISGCVGRWVFQATRRRFLSALREWQEDWLKDKIHEALKSYRGPQSLGMIASHVSEELQKMDNGGWRR